MPCPLCASLESRAANPRFIADLARSVVFLGERQNPRGWCVLVLKDHVEHMAGLPIAVQSEIFGEVARVAAAIRTVFMTSDSAAHPLRINYECLGNQVAHVHWHVIPRHLDDPDPRNTVWNWSRDTIGPAPDKQALCDLALDLRTALTSHPS